MAKFMCTLHGQGCSCVRAYSILQPDACGSEIEAIPRPKEMYGPNRYLDSSDWN